MLVKRIAAYTHLSLTVYELQRDIGRKLQLFPTPLHLTPPFGVIPLDDLRDFWWMSCRMASCYNMVQKYPRKVKPSVLTDNRHDRRQSRLAKMGKITNIFHFTSVFNAQLRTTVSQFRNHL